MGADLPTPAHCLLLLIRQRLKRLDTKAALSQGGDWKDLVVPKGRREDLVRKRAVLTIS